MKLSFRNLKKNVFTIEAEPSTLVSDIKKLVAEKQSATPEQIRLIHSGKVLADASAIETYNVKETDQIICMVSAPKVSTSSSQGPSIPITSSTPTPAAPDPAQQPALQNAPATPTPAPVQPSERRFGDTAPLIGPDRQAAIADLEAMGFERPQVERALRAAWFNPDRAVEFLLSGIPENVEQEGSRPARTTPAQNQPSAAPSTGTNPASGNPAPSTDTNEPVNLFEAAAAANQGGRGSSNTAAAGQMARGGAGTGAMAGANTAGGLGAVGGNLDFLRENPMFQQLRGLVQSQPQMLENVLQQVSAANPQLAQLIANNPEQFLQLLTEGEEGEGVQLPPGTRDISVTEEERDAIERLCGLGFERDLVIQAYFACDKNEDLAANFLFDHPGDDDEPPPQP